MESTQEPTVSVPNQPKKPQDQAQKDDDPPLGNGFSAQLVLRQLKERIFKRRPILGEIIHKHGRRSLFEYSREFLDVNLHPKMQERKEEMIRAIRNYARGLFGWKISREVVKQLLHCYMVSTCDHHGPITHPFFINSNLVSGLSYRDCRHHQMKYLIVLSYGSVSLNNNSSYSRGILFNAGTNGTLNHIKLPLFPDTEKTACVYGLRPYTERDLNRAKGLLKGKKHAKEIDTQTEEKVMQILAEVFGNKDVLKCQSFSEQITKVNYRLWPMFLHQEAKKIHEIPDLLYLEIETLVNRILIDRHFKNPDSILYKFIFDPRYLDLITKYFDGIEGAFFLARNTGTFLFWGLDQKNRRVRLIRDGMTLKSEDGSIAFELMPATVAKLLEEKKIFPSMIVTYAVVSLYYGMKCLGGFSQVNYLTRMKEAWIKMNADLGNYKEIEMCARIQTKELCEGLTIAYVETPQKGVIPATGIDLILYGNEKLWDRLIRISKRLYLEDLIEPMIPEIYRVVYSFPDREEQLMQLSPEKILDMKKMVKKFAQSRIAAGL